MSTKTVITDKIIKQAENLASKGYSTQMIASSLGIGYSTAKSNNKALKSAIKRGRDKARKAVVDKMMKRKEESDTILIYLSKSLKIFEDEYPTGIPKSISEATERVADIYKQVAENRLDKDKGDRLIKFLDIYIRVKEISEMEKRLEDLENRCNNYGK